MKTKKDSLGFITGLFDINRDGKLDIVEEALLISTIADTAEEARQRVSEEKTVQSNKKSCERSTINLDDLDIEGI